MNGLAGTDRIETADRGTFRVRSRTSGKRYWIEVGAKKIRCDCPDFRMRHERGGGHCKHIVDLAQHLGFEVLRRIQERSTAWRRPAAAPASGSEMTWIGHEEDF